MESLNFWERQSFRAPFDVLVVGAGFVGSWTAFKLKKAHPLWRIGLLDAHAFAGGASTRNAGFACFGSPTEVLDDLHHEPESQVWDRLAARWNGLQQWKTHFHPDELDWEPLGGHELFLPGERLSFEAVSDRLTEWNRILHPITGEVETYRRMEALPGPSWHGGIRTATEAQLHPGKALHALHQRNWSLGVHPLLGHAIAPFSQWVQTVQGWNVPTSQGVLAAQQVVVCTNGRGAEVFPDIPVVPARGQVLLTQPLPSHALGYRGSYHADAGYLYFRTVGDRILVGGGRNRFRTQEQTASRENTEEVMDFLRTYLSDCILPGVAWEEDSHWAGTMGFGPRNEKETLYLQPAPGVWGAVRLGGMGVALAPEVADRLVDRMNGVTPAK